MEILPAIDLKDGKVVRLARGDYDRQTVYSDDPAAVARAFAAAGARWIHVVDLNAAKSGRIENAPALAAIRKAVDLKIEFGGGLRSDAAVEEVLHAGVDRMVIGSAALENWPWFERLASRKDLSGRLALGLDARGGRLAVHGWTEQVAATPLEVAARVRGWPLGAIIYTDIARDGMLTGVNLEATAKLVAATSVPIIASGGVSSMTDVLECQKIGCGGVIVGRAYYEGKIDLAEACATVAGPAKSS